MNFKTAFNFCKENGILMECNYSPDNHMLDDIIDTLVHYDQSDYNPISAIKELFLSNITKIKLFNDSKSHTTKDIENALSVEMKKFEYDCDCTISSIDIINSLPIIIKDIRSTEAGINSISIGIMLDANYNMAIESSMENIEVMLNKAFDEFIENFGKEDKDKFNISVSKISDIQFCLMSIYYKHAHQFDPYILPTIPTYPSNTIYPYPPMLPSNTIYPYPPMLPAMPSSTMPIPVITMPTTPSPTSLHVSNWLSKTLKNIALSCAYAIYSKFILDMSYDYKFGRIYNHLFSFNSSFIRSGFKIFTNEPILYMRELFTTVSTASEYMYTVDPVSICICNSLPKEIDNVNDIEYILKLIKSHLHDEPHIMGIEPKEEDNKKESIE